MGRSTARIIVPSYHIWKRNLFLSYYVCNRNLCFVTCLSCLCVDSPTSTLCFPLHPSVKLSQVRSHPLRAAYVVVCDTCVLISRFNNLFSFYIQVWTTIHASHTKMFRLCRCLYFTENFSITRVHSAQPCTFCRAPSTCFSQISSCYILSSSASITAITSHNWLILSQYLIFTLLTYCRIYYKLIAFTGPCLKLFCSVNASSSVIPSAIPFHRCNLPLHRCQLFYRVDASTAIKTVFTGDYTR